MSDKETTSSEGQPQSNLTKALWNKIDIQITTFYAATRSERTQMEVGKLINLLNPIKAQKNKGSRCNLAHIELVLQLLAAALDSLLLQEPNFYLARETRRELQDLVKGRWRLTKWFNARQPSSKVLWGLGVTLAIIIVFQFFIKDIASASKLDQQHLSIVIWFGTIGSVVSLMVRLNDFYLNRDGATSFYFLTGCFKPFLGIFFALFLYAVMKSSLLPIKEVEGKALFAIMVLSFLAGFSERFAKDIADKAEGYVINKGN